MACIRCSSVMELSIWVLAAVDFAVDLLACSFRDEFLAFTGILPVMYRWALPAPLFIAGNRRAMTVVERGIMAVSSSYSTDY